MSTPALSERQATAQEILLARQVAALHWPNRAGRCPACGVPRCSAYQLAAEILRRHSRPPAPILPTPTDTASGPTANAQTPGHPAVSARQPGEPTPARDRASPDSPPETPDLVASRRKQTTRPG